MNRTVHDCLKFDHIPFKNCSATRDSENTCVRHRLQMACKQSTPCLWTLTHCSHTGQWQDPYFGQESQNCLTDVWGWIIWDPLLEETKKNCQFCLWTDLFVCRVLRAVIQVTYLWRYFTPKYGGLRQVQLSIVCIYARFMQIIINSYAYWNGHLTWHVQISHTNSCVKCGHEMRKSTACTDSKNVYLRWKRATLRSPPLLWRW